MIFDEVQKLESDAKSVHEGVIAMKSAIEAYGEERYVKGWDEAMAQAGSGGSTDKIYSEAEMNAIIAEENAKVVASLQPQIDALQGQVNQIPAEKEAAVNEFKARVLSEYEAQQVVESTSETGFANLLK